MYYDYFGFRQPPFKITPDTRLFYPGGERGAVLEALVYAVLNGEGIVKVVGEVGSGKTMLCRMLEQELPDKVEVVYLANPSLSPENTLHAIAFELGLDIKPGATRFEIMNRLQEYLLQRHSEDKQVVVFVEEAQGMPLETLEEIRLLSNLETQQHKLLQIVLFGQPELDEMIATPMIRQLRERITYSFRLNPFKTGDIQDYLNSRVRACGYRSGTLFDRSAVNEIERYSMGLLRRINILADKALLAAYAGNTHRVSAKHIIKAARDSEFSTGVPRRRPRPRHALAMAAVLALIGLVAAGVFGIRPAWMPAPEGSGIASPPAEPGETGTDKGGESPSAVPESAAPAVDETAASGAADPPAETGSGTGKLVENPEKTGAGPAPGASAEKPQRADPVPAMEGGTDTARAAAAAEAGQVTDVGANRQTQLYTVLELGGFEGSTFSGSEAGDLRRQLDTLPPEAVVLSDSASTATSCDRCWSLIYRPVKSIENL